MPDESISTSNSKEPQPNNEPTWKTYSVIAIAAVVGLTILWSLCLNFIPLKKDRLPAFAGFAVNYLILMAMFVQAHITQRQWKSMQEGLDETT